MRKRETQRHQAGEKSESERKKHRPIIQSAARAATHWRALMLYLNLSWHARDLELAPGHNRRTREGGKRGARARERRGLFFSRLNCKRKRRERQRESGGPGLLLSILDGSRARTSTRVSASSRVMVERLDLREGGRRKERGERKEKRKK